MDSAGGRGMPLTEYLEAGVIANTHGLRGEVRIQPWADSASFLAAFKRIYIDGSPVEVVSARVHKSMVIAALDGVDDIESAIKLKNKVVHIARNDVKLDEGRYFIADIIGLRALDADTGEELGVVADVLSLPANDVYVIKGKREMLIPAVPEFILETSMEAGAVRIRLIEGM